MSQIRWLEDVIYKYGTLIISFVLLTIVLISANIKYVIKHKHNSLEVNLTKMNDSLYKYVYIILLIIIIFFSAYHTYRKIFK